EGVGAKALERVDEALAGLAYGEVMARETLEERGHVFAAHGLADEDAEPARTIGPAAEQDLVPVLAGLLDTEDANMADMVMAAGVDAARDLDGDVADRVLDG